MKKLFRNLDNISPNISLKYEGNNKHSSSLSGLLTIAGYIIIFSLFIQMIINLIFFKNPTSAFYFRRLTPDAGFFPLNSSSMFHYLYYNNKLHFNPKIYQIIGLQQIYIEDYIENNCNISLFNHYIYEPCTKKYINNNQEIEKILNYSEYLNFGLCISKYYNSKKNKLISINDSEFEFPYLDKGRSNEKGYFYGIILQKCINNTLINNNFCESNEVIENYFIENSGHISFYVIDKFIDIMNYSNPLISAFSTVTTKTSEQSFTVDNLNFQPLLIRSNEGYLSDSYKEKNFYIFEQDEKQVYSKSNQIYLSIYFWMQNNMVIYQRKYKNLKEVIIDIGGYSKVITSIITFLNIFINKYKTFKDLETLIIIKEKKSLNSTKTFFSNNNFNLNGLNKIYSNNKRNEKNLGNNEIKKNNYIKEESNAKMSTNMNNDIKLELNKIRKLNTIKLEKITENIANKYQITRKIFFCSYIYCCKSIKMRKKIHYIETINKFSNSILSEENIFDLYFNMNQNKIIFSNINLTNSPIEFNKKISIEDKLFEDLSQNPLNSSTKKKYK